MKLSSVRFTLFVTSGVAALYASQACGQEAQPARAAGVEDIVVTARRSSESLVQVPVAVTAISAETLVKNNVSSLGSLAQMVPFVQLTKFPAGNGAFLSIRGIGSAASDAGVQQSVLVNFDNVMIGRGRMVQQGLYDLAQIEVLKGPQALFYGKNSPAGVISISTADPSNTPEGFVRAGYEFEARERYIEGAFGGPVTDTLKVRVAGRYAAMRGWIRNDAQAMAYPANPTFAPWVAAGATLPGTSRPWGPHTRDIGFRVTAVWEPSDSFSAKLKYSYGNNENHGEGQLYIPYCGRGRTNPTGYGSVDPNTDCKFDNHVNISDFPVILTRGMPIANNGVPYGKLDTNFASLNIGYKISDNLDVASVSSFYKLDDETSLLSAPIFAGIYSALEEHTSSIAQEFRLSSNFDSPVNFVIGAYFDRIHQRTVSHTALAPLPADPVTGAYYTYDRFADFVATSQSLFGQIKWDILDNLELAGGVRYTHDKRKSLDGVSWANAAFAANIRAVGDYFDRTYEGSNYSPEATLTWHPERNQTLYVAYRTGYKSGGFSYPGVLLRSFTSAITSFKPETAKGFEAGYKAELFNNRLRVDLTAYQTTYSNQQTSSFYAALASFIVTNAARARVRGVELQGVYVPVAGVQFHGAWGYNDAKYLSYPGAPCIAGNASTCTTDFSGMSLSRAPKWSGNFGASVEQPVSSGLKAGLTADAFYTSSYYAQDNLDPATIQNGYWKFNASISVGAEDDSWKLSLIGRNLTDKIANLYAIDMARGSPGDYVGVPIRPREVALEATMRF